MRPRSFSLGLVFIPSLGAFLAPDLLGGAKTFMIGSLIDEQFKGSLGNWPFGAAVSMILMTLVMIALLIYARASAKGGTTPLITPGEALQPEV